jgi:cell division protein FtsB
MIPTTGPRRPEANRYQRAFQGSYEGAIQYWPVILATFMVGVALLSGYEFLSGETGWLKMKRVQADTERMLAENQSLTVRVKNLREQERLLASDDFVLEKIVRENLRLTRPGEILYIFDETPVNAASTEPVDVTVAKRLPTKVGVEEGR